MDRREKIEVIDYNYQNVILDSTVELNSSFNGGQYLSWEITGHVTFKITLTSGGNPVVSGIFIDDPNYVPPPPLPPSAPSNLKVTVVSKSQLNLSWADNSSNESGFKIERSKVSATSGFTEIATTAADATTYSNTGLLRNTTYYYRVRSYNANGSSAYSNTDSGKTLSN